VVSTKALISGHCGRNNDYIFEIKVDLNRPGEIVFEDDYSNKEAAFAA